MPRINTVVGGLYCGLGDIVLLSWVAEAARDTDDPMTFYATRDRHYDVLKLLGQEVSDEPQPPSLVIGDAYGNELRERGARLKLDYVRELLGITTTFKRPRTHFSAEELDWARQTKQAIGGDPLVLCFPQAGFPPREWPSCYWVELAWQLKERNIPAAFFLVDEDPRYAGVPLFFFGLPLRRVAALMSVARLVIGSCSGPAHLAGTIGVPTLALLGASRGECVYGHIPNVITLASDEPPGCAGCHYGHPYRAACDVACQSLYSLWPRVVLARIVSVLDASQRKHPDTPFIS